MLIDISELAPSGSFLDAEVIVPDFDIGAENPVSCAPVAFSASLRKTRRGIEVAGRFYTVAHLRCGRCLAELDHPISGRFRLFVVPGGDEREEFEAFDDDDPDAIDLYPIEGSIVDVAEMLREQIDLALPLRLRCEDVDRSCRPIPEVDGAMDDEAPQSGNDERWGELLDLRRSLEKKRQGPKGP